MSISNGNASAPWSRKQPLSSEVPVMPCRLIKAPEMGSPEAEATRPATVIAGWHGAKEQHPDKSALAAAAKRVIKHRRIGCA
jgi:hypothetical protein